MFDACITPREQILKYEIFQPSLSAGSFQRQIYRQKDLLGAGSIR
jgi:hypothetical protein